MLHPAKRELRYQDQIVLWPREFVVEVGLEILHRLAREAERFCGVRLEFGGLRLADVDVCLQGRFRVNPRRSTVLNPFPVDVLDLWTKRMRLATGVRTGNASDRVRSSRARGGLRRRTRLH